MSLSDEKTLIVMPFEGDRWSVGAKQLLAQTHGKCCIDADDRLATAVDSSRGIDWRLVAKNF